METRFYFILARPVLGGNEPVTRMRQVLVGGIAGFREADCRVNRDLATCRVDESKNYRVR